MELLRRFKYYLNFLSWSVAIELFFTKTKFLVEFKTDLILILKTWPSSLNPKKDLVLDRNVYVTKRLQNSKAMLQSLTQLCVVPGDLTSILIHTWPQYLRQSQKYLYSLPKYFFNQSTLYQGIDFKNRFEISFQKYSNLEFS